MTTIDAVSAETETLLLLDPAELVPNPLNPRKHVDVDDEFVASIKAEGVLEPALAFRRDRGDGQFGVEYVLLCGERRRLGASKARVKVPTRVRDEEPSPAEQKMIMLSENGHRTGLRPLEEARTYVDLIETDGLTQQEIVSKTGRSKGYVSKNVAIVQKLPPKALAHFDNGALSFTTAYELTHVADDLDFVEKYAGSKLADDAKIRNAVKDKLQGREWARAEKAKINELTAAGTECVDRVRLANNTVCVLVGNTDVHVSPHASDFVVWIALTIDDHKNEDCHVAVVDYKGDVIWGCYSPDAHDDAATIRRSTMQDPPTVDEINAIAARNAAPPTLPADDGRPSWIDARDRAVERRTAMRAAAFSSDIALETLSGFVVAEFLGEQHAPPRDWVMPVVEQLLRAPDEDDQFNPDDRLRELPVRSAASKIVLATIEHCLFPDPCGPDDVARSHWRFDVVAPDVAAAYVDWLRFFNVAVTEVEQWWLDACIADAEPDDEDF